MRKKILLIVGLLCLVGLSSGIAQDYPVDHDAAGVTVVVPDTWIFQVDIDNGTYWEPFTDIFGDGTIAVIANTHPEEGQGMNAKVAFIDPSSGEVQEYWAFYTDAGDPWKGPFNEKRTDGNPARIAVDRRPGGTRYMVAMETTPYLYDEFNSEDRWYQGFAYDDRVATVQIFNKTADGPVPITNVIDPIYQSFENFDAQFGQQMRYGGDIRFLSNGNILTCPEDRTKNIVEGGTAAIATIFNGETGEVIKPAWNASGDGLAHEIWSNVAAFNGGFVIRSQAIFSVYDNDGNLQYYFNQDAFSTITDTGRGDDTRIAANINGNYVYYAGKGPEGDVVLSRFDAVATTSGDDLQGVKEVNVNELDYLFGDTFKRAEAAVDELGNVCVVFDDTSTTGTEQTIARIFNSDMEPVTPSFFAFQYHDVNGPDDMGYHSHEPNVSMDNQHIVIAANGISWDEEFQGVTPGEQTFFIVLENPLKEETAVSHWELH
ncbi:MAG: hypothetical protein JXR73_01185 [Candidatus Omnitrophica bacterium]|nr:hypothetical protein [Candidatus Omnitrophota bacterium]